MERDKKIENYLQKELDLKINALQTLDTPIIDTAEAKHTIEQESIRIRNEIYQLKRLIEVIKIL